MMIANRPTKLAPAHRALIGAAALALVALSVITGLMTPDVVSAQGRRHRSKVTEGVQDGVPDGVQGGVQGGVQSGVPGGVAGGVQGGVPGVVGGVRGGVATVDGDRVRIEISGQDGVAAVNYGGQSQSLLEQAPSLAIRFENADDTPLVITDARIKFVKDEESLSGLRSAMGTTETYAFKLSAALTNSTSRKITGVGVELRVVSEKGKFTVYIERGGLSIGPGASFSFDNSGNRITTHESALDLWENCMVKVVGVQFEEPPHWGTLKLATNKTSASGSLLIQSESTSERRNEKEIRMSVTNVNDVDDAAITDFVDQKSVTTMPRITYRDKATYTPEARANGLSGTVLLSAVFGSDGTLSGFRVLRGLPDGLTEEAIEAAKRMRFIPATKDGQPVSTRAQIEYNFSLSTSQPMVLKQSGGVLQGSAIRKPAPAYPAEAKEKQISGVVQVKVLISEEGQVIEAEAISGHPLLRDAAVEAAKQWIFRPTELSGTPVKVEGVLTFNFTLQ